MLSRGASPECLGPLVQKLGLDFQSLKKKEKIEQMFI
jgi:hypothetical protein